MFPNTKLFIKPRLFHRILEIYRNQKVKLREDAKTVVNLTGDVGSAVDDDVALSRGDSPDQQIFKSVSQVPPKFYKHHHDNQGHHWHSLRAGKLKFSKLLLLPF